MKIELTSKQVLQYIVVGIKNRNYQAAIDIAEDCIKELEEQEKSNKPLDSDAQKRRSA